MLHDHDKSAHTHRIQGDGHVVFVCTAGNAGRGGDGSGKHRLGRPVFGPSFEVEVDTDLRIRSRTLDDRTVPYECLSGGAKEQLGILARLAGAALVAKEDAVPVLIDDALGFTDPERLAKMGEVFDTIGADGQVIVLTCSPTRYGGVKGAHRIDLDAIQ